MTALRESDQRASGRETGETGARRSIDPLILLQIYMVLLVGSPSIYIVQPLGAAGTPATIMGCVLLVVWLIIRFSGRGPRNGMTPVHWIAAIFAAAMLLGFVAGMLRPISPVEVSSAQRGLIMVASWIGVMLFVADSMRTWERLLDFLRFLVLMASVLAAMGIVQFLIGFDFVTLLHLPGLVQNSAWGGLYERSGFPRVSGTAIHSIEFAVVLAMALPVAVHFALTAERRRIWHWVQCGAIFVALPLTVARSGMVGLVLGLVFAFVVASKKQRWAIILLLPISAFLFRSAIPGLLGTIRELFLDAAQDNSIGGRLRDYAAVAQSFNETPLFGKGIFTYLPSIYRTLDNQYLGLLVEAGLIGLGAFVILLLVAIGGPALVGLSKSGAERSRAWSVAAGLSTAAILFVTFDVFGFPMAMGMFSLLVGASGVIWALSRGDDEGAIEPDVPVRSRRRGAIAIAASVAVIALLGSIAVVSARGVYEARSVLTVAVPQAPGQNAYDSKVNVPGVGDLVIFLMNSAEVRRKLMNAGVSYYELALGNGSLAPMSEVVGRSDSELVWVAARGATQDEAIAAAVTVRDEVQWQLAVVQAGREVPFGTRIIIRDTFTRPDAFFVDVRRGLALVGLVGLAGVIILGGVMVVGARSRPRIRRKSALASVRTD